MAEYLTDVPASAGIPCLVCGGTRRSLRYRAMDYAIGYLWWRRDYFFRGYMCGGCAAAIAIQSLLGGLASLFLAHPQALLWMPARFIRNIWRAVKGTSPPFDHCFLRSEDIIEGKVSEEAACNIANMARTILEKRLYDPKGAYLGVVAICTGVTDREFVDKVVRAIRGCTDKSEVSVWYRFAKEWERTLLAE